MAEAYQVLSDSKPEHFCDIYVCIGTTLYNNDFSPNCIILSEYASDLCFCVRMEIFIVMLNFI